ncbi:MAG TPA: TIGR02099 family protein [Gammaproteobacteria bacterium]|nr:TIGR02099 family protein [Gammaproteobacteria bacterium]
MIRRIGYGLWVGVAAALVALALLLTAVRILLPYTSDYRAELVALLSEQLALPLEVDAVEARWHGLGPRLSFQGLVLKDGRGKQELLRLQEAVVDIDMPRFLWHGSLQIARLTLVGMRLVVTRHGDGRMSVLGMNREGPALALEDFLRWLGGRERITIRDGALEWRDELRGLPPQHLEDIGFRWRGSGQRYQLDGHARLAGRRPQPFSFALDLSGRLDGPWNADLYLETRRLDVAKLPWELEAGGVRLAEGHVSLRLWGQWRNARLRQLAGRVGLRDLLLRRTGGKENDHAGVRVDRLAGDFLWERAGGGWRLALDGLDLEVEGRPWPAGSAQVAVGGGPRTPRLAVRFDDLDIEAARRLLTLFPLPEGKGREALAALAGMRPRGRLREGYAFYQGGERTRFSLAARFEGLQTTAWQAVPGVSGMAGRVVMNEGGGLLELGGVDVTLDLPRWFRAPLSLPRLRGRYHWLRDSDGWRLLGREIGVEGGDLTLQAAMDLVKGEEGAPRLDLEGRFSVPSLEPVGSYLPAAVMRPGLVRWLERAIVAGRVPAGTLSYHGPVQASPFAAGAVFEARFNVLDGVLDYAPGWPRIEEIEAGLVFHNSRLEVSMVAGKSLSSSLDEAHIVIPDMAALPARLAVEGRAEGPVGDVLRFLRETPLSRRFAGRVAGLAASGPSRLQLSFSRLLVPGGAVDVSGDLLLKGDTLKVSGDRPLEISALEGDLRFSAMGLSAEALRGRLLGMDCRFTVATVDDGGGGATVIGAEGRIDDATLRTLLPLSFFDYVGGETGWQATLTLWPPREDVAGAGELVIRSDLRGMAIALPAPLFKTAAERLPLTLRSRLPRSLDPPVALQLGPRLRGLFDLDSRLRLERGEILLGAGEPRLPSHGGLRLRGTLSEFSYSAWMPYVEKLEGEGEPLLRGLDVEVDRLEVFGRDFHQARVKGRLEDGVWTFDAGSRELQGYIEYPLTEALPVIMELEHLWIEPREEEDTSTDPRRLPPLVLHSKRFRYGQTDFDTLELRLSPQPTGVRVEKLGLTAPHLAVQSHGEWVVVGADGQKSIFDVVLTSDNLGKALARLGYEDNIKGGRARMKLAGHWDGDPAAIGPDRFNGTFGLEIKNGRLLSVEPGAGRIFGLLSLQALPRRLSLDFSDIFNKGFGFDEISGTFAIRNGIAVTRDLTMEGPAARIEAQGRVDLVEKRYDQTVTMIPHVTSGLPVAGVVAGGIGVGAAILLAEQVFRQEIEKMTRVRYRVTGPWDDPRVERLQEDEQQ